MKSIGLSLPVMNKTTASQFVEEVSGEIIGGDHKTGQLYYQGRTQGPRFSGSDDEVMENAKSYARQLKIHLGAEYKRLYPDGLDLRIW